MNDPIPRGNLSDSSGPSFTRTEYECGTVPIQCSGWHQAQPLSKHPTLERDIDADVVVIGAGVAGASLALHLAERGISAVLLEARQPGDGASGRNAGHVKTFLENLAPLETWPDQGRRFLNFFIQHRDIVFDLCRKHGIEGAAIKSGMVEAAFRKQTALEKLVSRWKGVGYDVDIIRTETLREMLGTDAYHYGVYWREGGWVNPYLFTKGMADAAARLGARVHGDSPVRTVEKVGRRWRVLTPGGSVMAQKVIICTNGHTGNAFFPELAHSQYPLVACGMATKPLPEALLKTVNRARVVLTQYPTGLYPLVIDGHNRMITATIPHPGRAQAAEIYFAYFLRYLHRTFPQTRDVHIEMDSYWTGMTASASHVYHYDYPKLYRVDDGVMALMNLGTWGNVMGPQLGMNLAQALADERLEDLVLPLEVPSTVSFQRLFELKVRYFMVPAARLVDRLGLA